MDSSTGTVDLSFSFTSLLSAPLLLLALKTSFLSSFFVFAFDFMHFFALLTILSMLDNEEDEGGVALELGELLEVSSVALAGKGCSSSGIPLVEDLIEVEVEFEGDPDSLLIEFQPFCCCNSHKNKQTTTTTTTVLICCFNITFTLLTIIPQTRMLSQT